MRAVLGRRALYGRRVFLDCRVFLGWRALLALPLLVGAPADSVAAQAVPPATARDSAVAAVTDSTPAGGLVQPRGGSEFWIPLGSALVPGLGQYIHGAPLAGLGYTTTALAGVLVGTTGSSSLDEIPRSAGDQLAFEAAHVATTSAFLSAWDAFHRAGPALRGVGKYGFLEQNDDLGGLLTAPLDFRFLGRWTTWVNLALAGGVTSWILLEDDEDTVPPFLPRDAAFATSLSLNAAVGEEAAFRGWLLPMLTQKLGGRFWLANGIQAGIFGLGHPQAHEFAWVIAGSAAYYGWITRRNGWSVREAVFGHFWYDALVVTASLLRDDRGPVTLLPVRIRF